MQCTGLIVSTNTIAAVYFNDIYMSPTIADSHVLYTVEGQKWGTSMQTKGLVPINHLSIEAKGVIQTLYRHLQEKAPK